MAVSKRDFEAVARVISREVEIQRNIDAPGLITNRRIELALRGIAEALADHFESANPRFDRERFLTACDVSPSPDSISDRVFTRE